MNQNFIRVMQVPDMMLYQAIKVNKDTKLEYKTDTIEQSLEELVFKTKTTIKKDNYESIYDTKITLKEGDIIIYESEERGYIVPIENFKTVLEIIEELKQIKEV